MTLSAMEADLWQNLKKIFFGHKNGFGHFLTWSLLVVCGWSHDVVPKCFFRVVSDLNMSLHFTVEILSHEVIQCAVLVSVSDLNMSLHFTGEFLSHDAIQCDVSLSYDFQTLICNVHMKTVGIVRTYKQGCSRWW